MDQQNSNSDCKDFLNSEQRNRFSDEDFEGNSRFEIDESESLLTRPEEIDDTIELYANDGRGNISISSEIFLHTESGSKTLPLCENDAKISIGNTLNENAAFNPPADLDFILSQHDLPCTVDCPFSIVPSVPGNNNIDTDSNCIALPDFELVYEPKTENRGSDILVQNMNEYDETFSHSLQQESEVQTSARFTASFSQDCRAEYKDTVQETAFQDDFCIPSSPECSNNIICYDTNTPTKMDSTGSCGFSPGQRDDDKQFNLKFPNESPSLASEVHGERRCEPRNCAKLVSVNTEAVVTPVGKPLASNKCGQRSSQKNDLPAHKKIKSAQKRHSCHICGKVFPCKQRLSDHVNTHTAEKPYACNICGERFSRKDILSAHMKMHTRNNTYDCNFCGKRFGRRDRLSSHINTHTGEKPYVCNLCNQRFSRNECLSSHMKNHTGEKSHLCDRCGKSFLRSVGLSRHKLTHTGEKPFSCNKCNFKCNRKSSLKRHSQSHKE